jgi:hypothetical protein
MCAEASVSLYAVGGHGPSEHDGVADLGDVGLAGPVPPLPPIEPGMLAPVTRLDLAAVHDCAWPAWTLLCADQALTRWVRYGGGARGDD